MKREYEPVQARNSERTLNRVTSVALIIGTLGIIAGLLSGHPEISAGSVTPIAVGLALKIPSPK